MQCVIPKCPKPGKHRLGMRCRVMEEPSPVEGKGKTEALWSVESDAYLCDGPAASGIDLTLMLAPTMTERVSIRVVGPSGAQPRSIPIKT